MEKELADAIAGSEGRLLVCETIGAVRPMLGDVTNAEFAAAMGADLIILNLFDVYAPVIQDFRIRRRAPFRGSRRNTSADWCPARTSWGN